ACNIHTTKQHRTTATLSMKNLISGFQVVNKKTKQKKMKNRKKEETKVEKSKGFNSAIKQEKQSSLPNLFMQ
ncbi:hypothetical protein ACUOJS_26430, partial [Escherichia coli]